MTSPGVNFVARADVTGSSATVVLPLAATVSDPDGDAVSVAWFGDTELLAEQATIDVTLPAVTDSQPLLLVVVVDDGRGGIAIDFREILIFVPSG